jgi:protein-disulfide isomerase
VYLQKVFHLSSDLSADGVEMPAKKRQGQNYFPFIIIAVVLLLAVGGGAWLFRSSKPQPPSTQKASATASSLAGANPPHVRGSDKAPVTLEEYGDFECPPCGALYPLLKKIEADYGEEKVRLVFRQFPLPQVHKHAMVAAYAAEAAGFQGRFWEMYDKLYTDQATWSKAPDARTFFVDYARDIGLDMNRFARDMNNPDADARVRLDYERGRSLGVTGTPTIFINGRMMPAETTDKDLRAMIDERIKNGGQ